MCLSFRHFFVFTYLWNAINVILSSIWGRTRVHCLWWNHRAQWNCNIWSRCIICQKITSENLASSTEKGIPSFLNAVAQRQDELYRRLVQEFGSLENVAPSHIKYHKKCVRSYTSKQNLKTFAASEIAETEVPETECDRSEKTR